MWCFLKTSFLWSPVNKSEHGTIMTTFIMWGLRNKNLIKSSLPPIEQPLRKNPMVFPLGISHIPWRDHLPAPIFRTMAPPPGFRRCLRTVWKCWENDECITNVSRQCLWLLLETLKKRPSLRLVDELFSGISKLYMYFLYIYMIIQMFKWSDHFNDIVNA